jgi:hypothetical protein
MSCADNPSGQKRGQEVRSGSSLFGCPMTMCLPSIDFSDTFGANTARVKASRRDVKPHTAGRYVHEDHNKAEIHLVGEGLSVREQTPLAYSAASNDHGTVLLGMEHLRPQGCWKHLMANKPGCAGVAVGRDLLSPTLQVAGEATAAPCMRTNPGSYTITLHPTISHLCAVLHTMPRQPMSLRPEHLLSKDLPTSQP